MAATALRRPMAGPRDRKAEIRRRYDSFVESLAAEESRPPNEPFSLASLKSTQNGPLVSAEVDFAEIVTDIALIKNEVAKYEGLESPLFRTINEACLKLKMKLDSPKFDDYRTHRRRKLIEIDEIMTNLLSKVHKQ